ncbi:MerR family transcriptional regulator [Streptomyces sp. NA04227]|uniref:MerR family transcriptional regulator n=1 Tax=Streptomyces sp. NA04227 TaxID=2742136 RepID=UPI00158FE4C2|nr:MerR family transcriptional regulator [Streptomyces sp. NA04227]QKW09904.1 MerR family transcriptional regulator [Streptomyces sp. NA04227]
MLIGELSRRTGVAARLLRYYEAQGLLESRREHNGYRHYDEDAVVTVRRVRALLDAGLSTKVIRSVLPCVRGEAQEAPEFDWCADLRAILQGEMTAMDEHIDNLRRTRGTLADYLAQSPAGPAR